MKSQMDPCEICEPKAIFFFLITKLKSLYSLSKHKHENKINTPNSLALAGQQGALDREPANVSPCT